ncbi:MAG TPA: beta-L-arabinofuranosidase domain-containing protein [Tepidisphaeraceae bacterium]|jgi:hypothetical protein
MRRRACFIAVVLLCCAQLHSEAIKNAVPYAATPLPLSAVRLTGGPLKIAQDKDAEYLLALEPDRMLYYLRQRAGLEPKAQQGYGGWDGGGRQLTGHIAGHYLSAVSLMYAATGDERFKQRADYIVSELKEIQDKQGDGYLGALLDNRGTDAKVLFKQVSEGNIRSGGFDLNGLWSPWYVEHKIYAGLRDAYRLTGNQTALDVETKFAGWCESIVGKLDDAQDQKMLATEFGGMNEVLADLYADTGDKRWLTLSEKFYHKAVVDPLANHQDILAGKHGNTQVPKLLGELMRYIYSGNQTSGEAAKFFWERVAEHHSFATGGHGRNEYFGRPDQLNGMVDGRTAESCNVYNMLKMTRQLFAVEPKMEYADFMERALFNHVLASMDPETGRTCYMVPVGRGVQHEYQQMMQSFTCCVGTGMESHALHGDGIYYESGDKLWINFFAPSTAQWKSAGVTVVMDTTFPEGETAALRLACDAPKEFTLAIRRPWWAGDGFAIKVNGEAVKDVPKPGSYVELNRHWQSGDTVAMTLPKALHTEPLKDNPGRMALMWGPLVLAGDLGPEQRGQGRRGGQGVTTRPAAQASQSAVPVFVTDSTQELLKPVADKPGTFRTDGIGKDRDVEFVPFYRLHQHRYGVYWDVFTTQQWAQKAATYAAEQEKQRKIEAATVAFAQPGEMQPERDFNYQGEGASTGRVMERASRRGGSWFSFDLPVDPGHPMKLIVTYSTEEQRDRSFEILADGTRVGEQSIQRRSPEQESRFFDAEYAIPDELVKGKQKVTVRFQPTNGSEIANIFGVRMIRADAER